MTDERSARLHWGLCLAAVPLGLAFAGLTITGAIGPGATKVLVLVMLAIIGISVPLLAPTMPFRHGLVAGFLCCLAAVETQALFLSTYFANNPEYANLEMPFGLSPRVATAVLGPFNALLGGAIAGAIAGLIGAVQSRRRVQKTRADGPA